MAAREIYYIARVIRIISDSRIIIDAGKDTFNVGDEIYVFGAYDDISDLCGNSLGAYEVVKERLKVIHTADNYSVCAKFIDRVTNPIPVSDYMFSTKHVSEEAPLKVDKADIDPIKKFDNNCNYIKVGDYVNKC